MKKILNIPGNFVDESLNGILRAHAGLLKSVPYNNHAIVRADSPSEGKVAIVTGGGFGHLPLFLGYVGKGLCDGCAVGNVFTSPSCESILDTARALDCSKGILFLFGNYMGDQMNFEMASELLEGEGIDTAIIRAADDVASASRAQWQERRGIAGIFFVYKIAGALAERGYSLSEVVKITSFACERIASYGISFTSCQLPESDIPIFQISDSEMELGMGIHGEKGVKRCEIMTAHEIADYILNQLVNDLGLTKGDKVAALVNGLGSTSREELYILYGEMADILEHSGISIVNSYVGEYVTSMEMGGASISLLKLTQDLEELIRDEAVTPFIRI